MSKGLTHHVAESRGQISRESIRTLVGDRLTVHGSTRRLDAVSCRMVSVIVHVVSRPRCLSNRLVLFSEWAGRRFSQL